MDQENKDPESLSEIINKLGTNYYMFKQLINSEIRKAYWLGYNDHRNKMSYLSNAEIDKIEKGFMK